MVSTYTFALSRNEQKIKEYGDEGDSLTLIQNSHDYDEYVYERIHSEKIRRYRNGDVIDDRIEYVKTTHILHFTEENYIVIKAGIKYSGLILNRFGKKLNLITEPLIFDYSMFLGQMVEQDLDFEPIKISILNYIREKYMVGDILASLSNKDLLLELVDKFSASINSLRLKLWDIGEIEVTKDFVLRISDSNLEEFEILNLLKLMFRFGGRIK